MCVCGCLVAQSCPTLCDPMGYSQPGSSVRGILQARILEWVAIPFCRGSLWPRYQTCISYIAGRFFTVWATREACVISCYLFVCLFGFKQGFSCGMWDLVPWPGVEPKPPASRVQSLSHWTTREAPVCVYINSNSTVFWKCPTQTHPSFECQCRRRGWTYRFGGGDDS